MVTWHAVELTAGDHAEAERIAGIRQGEAAGWTPNRGTATLSNDLTGALGELAAARFLGVPHPMAGRNRSYSDEQDRHGEDVGGYEVRAAARPHFGLIVRETDRTRPGGQRMMLVLTHDYPCCWIAGWTTVADAIRDAEPITARGFTVMRVPQRKLRPFARLGAGERR